MKAMQNALTLKPGREKSVLNFHPWIFSGAVAVLPDTDNGAIVPVLSSQKKLLGHAMINRNSGILARLVSFGEEDPITAIGASIERAVALRKALFDKKKTNAYRLINAEGDFLPGLIADQYDKVIVLDIGTLGMEKLKPFLIEKLKKALKIQAIYEKSDGPSRKAEGLKESSGWLWGKPRENAAVLENGLTFTVSFEGGQKTGFFLDQRETRALAERYAAGRKVLNVFAYTGGFNAYALRGGAKRADAVETGKELESIFRQNMTQNGFPEKTTAFFEEDAFSFLRSEKARGYDFIILDPPAFAKKKMDVIPACRGYKDINRLALKNLEPEGLLLTSSCSHFVDENLFRQVIFEAAKEAGRNVQILSKHLLAPDHPINIYHPQGEYLKSFLLRAE